MSRIFPNVDKAFARFLPTQERKERSRTSVTTEASSTSNLEPVSPKNIEGTRIIAKAGYSVVGVCPYCQVPMSRSTCCGQEVYFCKEDRFVAPLPDEGYSGLELSSEL